MIVIPVDPYWSSLEETWKATAKQPLAYQNGLVHAAAKTTNDWQLIKSESRVRVILLDPATPHLPVICKIYRTPWHLLWRTTGMVSRANREFTALMEAHRHGLPVVCPRYWAEARLLGTVTFSAIGLEMLAGSNLEQSLKNKHTSSAQRMRLARESGVLVSQLHRGGLYWATAYPRNILLQQDVNAKMLAIDMPYAHWLGHDLTASDTALIDLRGMLKCEKEDWGFNQKERMEFFLGYCSDDMALVSELMPLATPHSALQSKLERLKRRAAHVLLNSPRSAGRGGAYHAADSSYHQRDKQAIGID